MKRKFTVITGFIAAAAALFLIAGRTAEASGFDAAYYARRYPDVVNALGDDPAVLYNHYLKHGIKEHRFQNAEEETAGRASKGETGYSTYIDVDIENQTMTYYENGQVKLTSDCVTGDESKGRSTPKGTYSITVHKSSTYLIGPTWKTWVDRWMKFTDSGCGLHDATWRSDFGGDIYKTNGSHGCVNLPHDVALSLYDMVDVGTVVVVH